MENARTFTVRLAELLRSERSALAEFLVALAEFDRRRLWVELGHASLFSYLHRELGLSKGAAFYRKTAAELVQRFPEVIEPLRDGRLCYTSVVELARVLTHENRDEVLPRFFLLSRREAKEVSAEIRPVDAPPRRELVTAVRVAPAAQALALGVPAPDLGQAVVHLDEPVRANSGPGSAPTGGAEPADTATPETEGAPAAGLESPRAGIAAITLLPATRPPADEIDPLTSQLSRLHVTVSRRFLEKLEAVRAALSHSHPGAGMEEILEAGLDLVLARHARRRGLVEKPRREAPPSKPEHVPAHVKRAVWKRDGGRCQWGLEGGGICGSTHQVELDHVNPRGLGGPSTIENTRILCRFHNDLAARGAYGDEWMDGFTRRRRGPPPVAEPARAPP